jgi:hypothetical protein
MRSICFAVAILLLASIACKAQTPVFGTAGADCTIEHSGKLLNEFVMPYPGGGTRAPDGAQVDDFPSAHLAAIDSNLGSVAVTCSKAGFKTRSVTISVQRMKWFSTVAPCGVPEGSTPEQIEALCGDYNRRAVRESSGWTVDYPRASVLLEREDKK